MDSRTGANYSSSYEVVILKPDDIENVNLIILQMSSTTQLIWALLVELWQNDQFFSCSDREHTYISKYASGSRIRNQKRT